MPACAYCGTHAPLTRDHVWPACFLERQGRTAAHFSTRSGVVHGADYVVNDVCGPCNHERLSPLDAYFCDLYDRYFAEPRDFGTTLTIEYDFGLLARCLLKIAYNSSRTGTAGPGPLTALAPFILGVASIPEQLAVVGELVAPSLIPDGAGVPKKVLPLMYRSAVSQFTKPGGDQVLTRVIAVNSFYFHLILPRVPQAAPEFEAVVQDFVSSLAGSVRLSASSTGVTLTTSPQDGIRSFMPHLEANKAQYDAFFKRRRKNP